MTQLQDSDAFTGTEAQEERPEETRAEPEVGVGQLEVSHLGDIGEVRRAVPWEVSRGSGGDTRVSLSNGPSEDIG